MMTLYHALVKFFEARTVVHKEGNRMFGHDLDWWNTAILWSLALTVVAALCVLITTRIVIVLQGRNEDSLRREIAYANERTAKAELEIARLSAKRLLSSEQEKLIASDLAKFPITHVNVLIAWPTPEVTDFAGQLGRVFEKAFEIRGATKKPGDADFVMVVPLGGEPRLPKGVVISYMHNSEVGKAFAKEVAKLLSALMISASVEDAGPNTSGDAIGVTVGEIP